MSTGVRRATASLRARRRPDESAPETDSLRILFFHWNGDLYGASRSLLRLTSRLAKGRHRPVVVLGNRGPLAALLTSAGVEVRYTRWMAAIERSDLRSPLRFLRLLTRLAVSVPLHCRTIAQTRPDVVHTNASVVLTTGLAARIMGRPHVWHMRETFSDFPRLWKGYQRVVSMLSTRIVCISRCVASQFDSDRALGKIEVIHNGIPAEETAAPSTDRVEGLRARWSLEGAITIGVVGRINLGRKGQHLLVESAASLAGAHPNARFLFVGSAYPGQEDQEIRLREMIREQGLESRFVLTGEMGDLSLIYGLLDVVVVPSPVPEPFGNTAPEAMAYGLPVVGSDLGGTAEIVEHGVTGYLFPPGDAEALAACLEVLLADDRLREAFGEAGRRAFQDRFEFEQCYERMSHLFTDVAAVPRRGGA